MHTYYMQFNNQTHVIRESQLWNERGVKEVRRFIRSCRCGVLLRCIHIDSIEILVIQGWVARGLSMCKEVMFGGLGVYVCN